MVGLSASRPAGRPARVGFFGLLGSGNLGNDGSLRAMVEFVRSAIPDADVDVFCDGPDGIASDFDLPAERMHWNIHEYETASSPGLVARKALGKLVDGVRTARWVARHDVVIVPGMGVLEASLPLRPWGTPWSLLLLTVSGRILRRPVALVSVGADDVAAPAVRRLFVAAARHASYLSFRDEHSRAAMVRAGLSRADTTVYPDVAFGLAAPPGASAPTGVVAVGVLDYHGGNDDRSRAEDVHAAYLDELERLVGMLLDEGHTVRLVVGASVDEVVTSGILERVRRVRPEDVERIEVPEVADLSDVMTAFADADAVVATRYHNVVCALRTRRPTVSVGYAEKNRALMGAFGLGGYCQRADTFDADVVLDQLHRLANDGVAVRHKLDVADRELVSALREQFDILAHLVLPRPPSPSSGAPAPRGRLALPAHRKA